MDALRQQLETASPEERPVLARQLAELCYEQGDLGECRRWLNVCLEGFGCRVPHRRSELWRSPHAWQFWLLQLPLKLPSRLGSWLARWLDENAVRSLIRPTEKLRALPPAAPSRQMEMVLAWDRLTMLEAFEGELDLAFHAGGEMGAGATRLGAPSGVLARSYAMTAAGCTTTIPLPRLADFYRKHSLEMARELGDPAVMSQVLYCHGAIEMGRTHWAEAELLLSEAAGLAGKDLRLRAECEVVLADVYLCQGKLRRAFELIDGLDRPDPQMRLYAGVLRGLLLALTGRSPEAIEVLTEVAPLVNVHDRIAVTNWRGANAMAHGDAGLALPLLRRLGELPAPHWCRLGVFWATYTALGRPEARAGVNWLVRRAPFFPLCAPGAWLCQGVAAGDTRALERALQLAEESAMPLEAGLALRHLGREEQAQARWEPHGLIRSPGS